jgi:hypothetical protein
VRLVTVGWLFLHVVATHFADSSCGALVLSNHFGGVTLSQTRNIYLVIELSGTYSSPVVSLCTEVFLCVRYSFLFISYKFCD